MLLAPLFSGYIAACAGQPGQDAARRAMSLPEAARVANLIPVVLLIVAAVLGSIYAGVATATEAAAVGVVGALLLSALQVARAGRVPRRHDGRHAVLLHDRP